MTRVEPRALVSAGLALAALLLPAGGRAQTGGRGHGARSASILDQSGCALCHRSHLKTEAGGTCGSTVALLVLAEAAQGGGPASCAAGGTPISLSCLRCHATPAARARDAELAATLQAPETGGTFLGDLADDHPLARRADQGATPLADAPLILALRGGVPRPFFSPGVTSPLPDCTTCHSVHGGPDPALEPESARGVCLTCHQPGRYLNGHAALGCTGCHTVHGGQGLGLLSQATPTLVCLSCHEAAMAAGTQPGALPMPPSPPHDPAQATASDRCTGCHAVHP